MSFFAALQIVSWVRRNFIPRTDDLYDLYDLYDLNDLHDLYDLHDLHDLRDLCDLYDLYDLFPFHDLDLSGHVYS